MPADKNYLSEVRDQYEDLPYPPRDPTAESRRLVPTFTDYLEKINHYGYAGRQTFTKGFRCLVAGGGTGDSTVFLAEQLRNKPNVEIVHLDLSHASIEVARKRIETRNLDNTRFVHGSILDLTVETHGLFDFISCTGVLHHMATPADGLRCLTGVLQKDGLIGLMLYGQYGRLGIYPIQEMLGYFKKDVPEKKDRIELGKSVLDQLPATHTFKTHNKIWEQETALYGDEGFYDLFLHSQDRAYNVRELYELLDNCGLEMRHLGLTHGGGGAYDPALYIKDKHVLDQVITLPTREQQHIAEILNGNMYMHGFFTAFKARGIASIENKRSVPFFHPEVMDQAAFANSIAQVQTPSFAMSRLGIRVELESTPVSAEIIPSINGKNTIADILIRVEKKLKKQGISAGAREIRQAFNRIYLSLNTVDWLLLRDSNVGQLQTRAFYDAWGNPNDTDPDN